MKYATLRLAFSMVALGMALLVALPARAEVTWHERTEYIWADANTCNGETMVMDGYIQYVMRTRKDGSTDLNYRGHFTGIGSQGNEYLLNMHGRNHFDPEEAVVLKTQRELYVTRGNAANQLVEFVATISGEPPVFHLEQFEVKCTGDGGSEDGGS